MALTLSILTSATTSGDVLAELTTKADFLDAVPVLKNIARGPNKGGDATQTTGLNQPKALPVVDGKGYLYLSGVSGNYASVPDAANLNGLTDFVMEAKDVYMPDWGDAGVETFFSKYDNGNTFTFRRHGLNINVYAIYGAGITSIFPHGLTGAATASVRVTRVGTSVTAELDTGSGYVAIGTAQTVPADAIETNTVPIEIGSTSGGTSQLLTGKISRAVIWDNGTQAGDPVLDVDFTAKSIPHGAKKFQCATGQVVTINQAGTDPATIIKRSVLRFDGADDFMRGLFNQTIDSGYMFAAFSVLGGGGASVARIFSINSTGAFDSDSESAIFSLRNNNNPADLFSYNAQWFSGHGNMFNDDNGDILHQSLIKNGTQKSLVNGAGVASSSNATTISSEEFNIVANASGANNAAIDLYWLGLFPATISPAEAARVVSWVNRRSIFDLKDGFGHYFYDGTKAPVGAISSGSASWNGRIVGSDNGDVDRYLTQATASNQPVSDGYKVTFADNTDHLDIPSTTQAGWQIVGTSLGTFAYRVNANAVTELNLLGNAGGFRTFGDLYGIILLPETANGKEIEAARQVLINRGAADGTTETNLYAYWYARNDIVEFKSVNTSTATSVSYAWSYSPSLTSFPTVDMSSVTNFISAWQSCTSLTSFPTVDMSSGTQFISAWQSCTSLTSFPTVDMSSGTNFTSVFSSCTSLTTIGSGALLGTSATNVNFSAAFYLCPNLEGLPANLDMSQGSNFSNAFNGCTSLATIGAGVLLGTAHAAATVNFNYSFFTSGLTALPANLDLSKGSDFVSAFHGCTSLTTVGTGVLLGTASISVDFTSAFKGCTNLVTLPANLNLSKGDDFQTAFQNCQSIVNFPAGAFDTMGTPQAYCFLNTWLDTNALSGASVENILVSINTSGQSAPSTGPQITIDYNVATGALSAATNTAINSLIGKGWQVVINGVITVPNVLSLAPAAAYSLRSFDSTADPNVVNVRRSSDSATADFKASEVSDGTLTTWVGSGNDGHVTTWYDQSSPARNAIQIFASEQPKIVESGVLVTEGGLAAVKFHTETSYLFINHATLSGQASLDSYYVTNATGAAYMFPSLVTSGSAYGMVASSSSSSINLSSNYGSPDYYANATQITGTTRGDIYTATSGGQKLVAHIGANTTNSVWGTASMNFGNYLNNDANFGYTGKLQEMIFFNTDQSTNRTGIEKNINDTYTIY